MAHQIIKSSLAIKLSVFFLFSLFLWSSCYYDNEEELYPHTGGCDTANVSYSGDVAPIMSANCNTCHSGAAPPSGVKTDNYADLSAIAKNGRLWGTVNHLSGFSPMPKDAAKLSDCDLAKIRKWIDDGSPDN